MREDSDSHATPDPSKDDVDNKDAAPQAMDSGTPEAEATASMSPTPDESDADAQLAVVSSAKLPLQLAPSSLEGSMGRLDSYEILQELGHGGMGIVLRGFDERLQRMVAIKVMSRELMSSDSARKRFYREARAAAVINHPNVVVIHAVSEVQGAPYLVMEHVAGCTLKARIAKEAPLDVREIVRIASQIASGLAAAHRQGVIHRDIKPSNVMLENGVERVKITDFGLARVALDHSDLSSLGDVMGTPAYMSPEQVEGKPLDPRSDLFNLGIVIYAMVTGSSPFQAASPLVVARKIVSGKHAPLPEVCPDVPKFLIEIVDRLLQKDPSKRYQTASDVEEVLSDRLAALNRSGSYPLSLKPSGNAGVSLAKSARSSRLAIVVGASIGVLAAGAIGTLIWNSAGTPLSSEQETLEPSVPVPPSEPDSLPLSQAQPLAIGHATRVFKHDGRVNAIEGTAEGHWASAADDGRLALTSIDAIDEPIFVVQDSPTRLMDVRVGRDGETLLTVSQDGLFRRRSMVDGGLLTEMNLTAGGLNAVAELSDGRQALVGGWSETVMFCDLASKTAIPLSSCDSAIYCIEVSPKGDRAAWGCGDGTIRLWDVSRGEVERTFVGHGGAVLAIDFSRDGARVASASFDDTVRVWETSSGEEALNVAGLVKPKAVRFLPDGERIVMGDRLGTVKIVSVPSGAVLATAEASADVDAIAVALDGKSIAIGDVDGNVTVHALRLRVP